MKTKNRMAHQKFMRMFSKYIHTVDDMLTILSEDSRKMSDILPKAIASLLFAGLFLISVHPALAQEKLPVRPYTNPDEMIAFERDTPFQEAMQVLDTFSQKFDNKFLIDRTETTGPININLPLMHWEDALELILNVRGLALREREKFYEIVEPSVIQVQEGSGTKSRFRDVSGEQQQAGVTVGELLLDTKSKEIRISATFFEGSRRVLNELGIDWSTLQDGVVQVTNVGAAEVSQELFSIDLLPQSLDNGIQVDALFRTFEVNNVGEILATPTIKVLDGQEGEVQVGQDIPILQRDFAGNTTTQLVQVGSILTVTPQIVEVNDTTFIYMQISAERSSGQRDAAGLVINKQNAESEILLLDGESTVIAGLYSTQESTIRRGIPILKDLPPWFFGLRYLFGFTSTDQEVRELIILIKAEVDPGIPERMANRLKTSSEVFQETRREMASYNESLVKGDNEMTEAEGDMQLASVPDAEQSALPDSVLEDSVQQQPADSLTVNVDNAQQDTLSQMEKAEAEPEPDEEPMAIEREPYQGDVEAPQAEQDQDPKPKPDTLDIKTKSPEVEPEHKDTTAGGITYYVIGGAFENDTNAKLFRNNLIRDGYKASIIRNAQRGYYYVIYNSYQNSQEARNALADIRQYKNSEAWLYTVKNN